MQVQVGLLSSSWSTSCNLPYQSAAFHEFERNLFRLLWSLIQISPLPARLSALGHSPDCAKSAFCPTVPSQGRSTIDALCSEQFVALGLNVCFCTVDSLRPLRLSPTISTANTSDYPSAPGTSCQWFCQCLWTVDLAVRTAPCSLVLRPRSASEIAPDSRALPKHL